MWELTTGKRIAELTHSFAEAHSVAFNPDGTKVVVGGHFQVEVFDLASRCRESGTDALVGQGWIYGLTFSPDGKTLATGNQGGGVLLYDPARWQPVPAIFDRGHRGAITSVAVSPDGRKVLSAAFDRTLRRWDLESPGKNQVLYRFQPATEYHVAWSPDGKSFATWTVGGEPPAVWDSATGTRRFTALQPAWGCSFSPDGQALAALGDDGTVRWWDAKDGRELHSFGHVGSAWRVTFSPDGKLLAVASDEKRLVKVWNVTTGVEVHSWQNDRPMWTVAFSPDGKLLATGVVDGSIILWDPVKKAKVAVAGGHTNGVRTLRFTPEGRRLVSASDDGTVRVWGLDQEPLRELTNLRIGPPGRILSLDLDPSGRYAVVGGANQSIDVLRLP